MSTPFILPPSPATVSLDVAVVQEIFRRLDNLDAKIDNVNADLSAQISQILVQVNDNTVQIKHLSERVDHLSTRVDEMTVLIDDNTARITNLEQQVGNNKDEEKEATCIPAQGSFFLRILSMILPSTTNKHLKTS